MIQAIYKLEDAKHPIDPPSGIRAESTKFLIFRMFLLAIALIAWLGSAASGQGTAIDTAHSKFLIKVSKSGVFSGFADNHEIEAKIAEGSLDAKRGELRLSVDSRQMKVLDPKLPADKRQQVQERMLGPEVLDSGRFPSITFESTRVEHRSGTVMVDGRLSLHGVTKPISIEVHVENGRYTGRFQLKQRDFDITPISIAGGTVKVKDELEVEFDIATLSGEKGN